MSSHCTDKSVLCKDDILHSNVIIHVLTGHFHRDHKPEVLVVYSLNFLCHSLAKFLHQVVVVVLSTNNYHDRFESLNFSIRCNGKPCYIMHMYFLQSLFRPVSDIPFLPVFFRNFHNHGFNIGVDGKRYVHSVLVIFKLHRRFILLYGPIVLLLPLSLLKHGSLAIPFPTIPFAFVQKLLRPEMVYAIWAKMFRSLSSTHPTGKKTTQTFKGTKMILVPKKFNDVLEHLARFHQQLNVLRRKQTVAIGLRHLLNPENVNPQCRYFPKTFSHP